MKSQRGFRLTRLISPVVNSVALHCTSLLLTLKKRTAPEHTWTILKNIWYSRHHDRCWPSGTQEHPLRSLFGRIGVWRRKIPCLSSPVPQSFNCWFPKRRKAQTGFGDILTWLLGVPGTTRICKCSFQNSPSSIPHPVSWGRKENISKISLFIPSLVCRNETWSGKWNWGTGCLRKQIATGPAPPSATSVFWHPVKACCASHYSSHIYTILGPESRTLPTVIHTWPWTRPTLACADSRVVNTENDVLTRLWVCAHLGEVMCKEE